LEDLKAFVAGHDVEGTGVTVKKLLEKVGKDSRGYDGWNTLLISAHYEQPEVLVQLLDFVVDPSITNDGFNALHYSAWSNRKSTRCIESLLKKMPLESINKVNTGFGGWTPLDCAYHNSSPIKNDIVQLICQHGGKANSHDRNGKNVGPGKGDLNDGNNVGEGKGNSNDGNNNNNSRGGDGGCCIVS
jgi:hypothetical protein